MRKVFNFLGSIRKDLLLHFFYGSIIANVLYHLEFPMILLVALAVIKEVYDYLGQDKEEEFDLLNHVWDIIFTCLPALAILFI
jgi:hypothetical protein